MRWLAYAHPRWMLAGLALAALALRAGFALRRGRLLGERRPPDLRRRHLRLAQPAVAVVLVGFAAGPLSVWALRDWTPFTTFHAWLGVTAASCFAGAAVLGRRLQRGRSRAHDVHAALGALGVLVAAVAAVAGFVLLP